jgi:hypothetical protein
MFFAMDMWWKYITKEITGTIRMVKRLEFISIAGVAGIVSAITTLSILGSGQYKTIHLLIINWTCLALIAVIKYLFFIRRFLRR